MFIHNKKNNYNNITQLTNSTLKITNYIYKQLTIIHLNKYVYVNTF